MAGKSASPTHETTPSAPKAEPAAPSATPHLVQRLQRAAGNRAVTTVLAGRGEGTPLPGALRATFEPLFTRTTHMHVNEHVHEHEANRRADDVVSGVRQSQPRPSKAVSPTAALQHAREVVASPGHPLDPSTRALMEPRFGHDFSRVRVHSDTRAAESARQLNALAYTVGTNIVLGSESPDTRARQHLLAHELTHVVQQERGAGVQIQRKGPQSPMTDYRFDTGHIDASDLEDPMVLHRLDRMTRAQLRVYRASVADPVVRQYIDGLLKPPLTHEYERNRFQVNKANLAAVAGWSYWEQRTGTAYVFRRDVRMTTNSEEGDAVYAALWSLRPDPTVASAEKLYVTIPPSAERRNALLYRFEFRPPASAGALPEIDIYFELERPASVADTAASPPLGAQLPELTFNREASIPGGTDQYFKTHPEEKRQIAYWVQRQGGSFEQLVVTKWQPAGNKLGPVEATFRIKGVKSKEGEIRYLSIEKIADRKPAAAGAPPADYHSRDVGDLMIEEAQTKPHAKLGDKLGRVDLTGVPKDELLSVKYVIAQYFAVMGTRNAEVDAVVPIGGTAKNVFYTLRFRSDNEVDVERVGEKGSTAKLDPDQLDIARVHGFDENAADPAKLKKWLGKRYRAVKPAGTTVEELRASANQAMATAIKTVVAMIDWFKKNYTMPVLDGPGTTRRLRGTHQQNTAQTPPADEKSFTAPELKMTELSMQTLTDTIVAKLATVNLGRKAKGRDTSGAEKMDVAAETFQYGSERSVVMYDGTFDNAGESVFRGGTEGVNTPETMTITHEFGHAVEYGTAGLRKAFNDFVAREKITPFTKYAAGKPQTEFFPEAFALSQTDPQWLRVNHYKVYAFFEELNATGKIPKKK